MPANPGFEMNGKLTARLNLQPLTYGRPEQRLAFVDAVVRELDTLPGVRSVAAANFLPFDSKSIRTYVDIEGRAESPFSDRPIEYRAVSPNYFQTMAGELPRHRVGSYAPIIHVKNRRLMLTYRLPEKLMA